MKKHFNAQGHGSYASGWAECGQPTLRTTTICDDVTCERCKKTQAFKKAFIEQQGRDGDKYGHNSN